MIKVTLSNAMDQLNQAQKDGCLEDMAEYCYEQMGKEFLSLISDTWVSEYLEEIGYDLTCPPWKQKQLREEAQIKLWYAEYPEMEAIWEGSIAKAYLDGYYEDKMIREVRTFAEQNFGDGMRGDNASISYYDATVKYFVVDGKEYNPSNMPSSHYKWASRWIADKVEAAEEDARTKKLVADKALAATIVGTYEEVTIELSSVGLTASITFPIQKCKWGEILEEDYILDKSYCFTTSLEEILSSIRVKAAIKKREKHTKFLEDVEYFKKKEGHEKLCLELLEELKAQGHNDGYRYDSLNGLQQYICYGKKHRRMWCNISVEEVQHRLGKTPKPKLKPRVNKPKPKPKVNTPKKGPVRPNPDRAAAYTRETVAALMAHNLFSPQWLKYVSAASKDRIYFEKDSSPLGEGKYLELGPLRKQAEDYGNLYEIINEELMRM
jgi:hypothetical protein